MRGGERFDGFALGIAREVGGGDALKGARTAGEQARCSR
jgi:hypothetical protein